MIKDNFDKWYREYYKGEIDPEFDDCYVDLLECYSAAWKRATEVGVESSDSRRYCRYDWSRTGKGT